MSPFLLMGHGKEHVVYVRRSKRQEWYRLWKKMQRGQEALGGTLCHTLVIHDLLLLVLNRKWKHSVVPFWPRSAHTVTLNETRSCFAQYEPRPAVVSLSFSFATLFAATLRNNVFTSLIEDFSQPYMAFRIKKYVFVYFL